MTRCGLLEFQPLSPVARVGTGGAQVRVRVLTMEPTNTGLERAEFEAMWTEVRYHEGLATAADLAVATRRLRDAQAVAADAAHLRMVGWVFPWRDAQPLAPAGN